MYKGELKDDKVTNLILQTKKEVSYVFLFISFYDSKDDIHL